MFLDSRAETKVNDRMLLNFLTSRHKVLVNRFDLHTAWPLNLQDDRRRNTTRNLDSKGHAPRKIYKGNEPAFMKGGDQTLKAFMLRKT